MSTQSLPPPGVAVGARDGARAVALLSAQDSLVAIATVFGDGSPELTEAQRHFDVMQEHCSGSGDCDMEKFFTAEGHLADVERKARARMVLPRPAHEAGEDRDEEPRPTLYIQTMAEFLAEKDEPEVYIINELVPAAVLVLIHGEPRARKSLVGFELAIAAATGTPPFGIDRFSVAAPVETFYIQEEDPRGPTRRRLRRLVKERCKTPPTGLHISCRRGVNLDDQAWVEALLADCARLKIRLLVFDAMRRLSARADEGPTKVREVSQILRRFVTELGITVVIVHHDVKPARDGQDARRRGHRASGGDWFAVCECPIHVEKIGSDESLVFPADYKFSSDPAPFTFRVAYDGPLITRLVGKDTTVESAARAGKRGVLFEWLKANGPASKRAIQKGAGIRWETLDALLEDLETGGLVDSAPGARNAVTYFVRAGSTRESGEEQPYA